MKILPLFPDPAKKAASVASALGEIERLLAELGPDADCDNAALELWQPSRALGDAVRDD
jgi:hypothetical protein